MIFISYNHNDEQLVDMIARRLELEFGRDNIFYDKWSMQPGDSIIGKMNEGLEQFTTFFYFLSPNSLTSKMVAKEWQSALNKAVNEKLRFVAVRLADCKPPAILTDTLYIDLYGKGLDDAVVQMKCVVKGENTYKPLEDIENIVAVVEYISEYEIKIEIKATLFSENDADFAFICDNEIDDFELTTQEPMYYGNTGGIHNFVNGQEIDWKMRTMRLYRPLTPKNPLRVVVKSKSKDIPLKFKGIMQMLSKTQGKPIKMVNEKIN